MNVIALTAWMLLLGSFVLFAIGLLTERDGIGRLTEGNVPIWLVFLASAIFASGLGQMVYNRAIQRLGASEAAVFINLSPFFSLVASALFLGETIHFVQWFGFFFIVVGVLLASGALEEMVLSSLRRKMIGLRR